MANDFVADEDITDPGLRTAVELFDLRQLDTKRFGDQILPILPRFNFAAKFGVLRAGWLHIGPAGMVTDEVYTVNYKPYGHQEGIFASEHYQLVRFRQDNGQPLIDLDSSYVRQSAYLGTPFSPTGVYEGKRKIWGGGSMMPVFDQARADEIIALMRERIHIAHQTHIKPHKPSSRHPMLPLNDSPHSRIGL